MDTPQNIYSNPINKFVAGFVGSPSMNFIACDVEEEAGKVVLFLQLIMQSKRFIRIIMMHSLFEKNIWEKE